MDDLEKGKAWAAARGKLVRLVPRINSAQGEAREAMFDIAANEILKASWPDFNTPAKERD